MDTPMNTKIRTILAAGMLLVTVLPVAACAKKAPSATTVPTTAEVTMTETDPASPVNETEASETQTETVQETTEAPVVIVESVESVKSTEQTKATKTAAKKTAKKTVTKTTKKTTKKTVKKTVNKTTNKTTKETAAKTDGNSEKNTAKTATKGYPELYSFGNCTYTCKGITIKMFIKKNDYATVNVTYKSQDRNDSRREINYTMSGKIDRETNTLTYTNCSRQERYYTELGLLYNKPNYTNGKGTITFKSGHKLVWKDAQQHFADSLTFSRTA